MFNIAAPKPADFENFECECGCDEFINVCKLKAIPLYLRHDPNINYVEIPYMRCVSCNKLAPIFSEKKKLINDFKITDYGHKQHGHNAGETGNGEESDH